MKQLLVLILTFLAAAPSFADSPTLEILSAGPQGEIASLQEANEIRVIFSEPMVMLGTIPKDLRPPFFSISPRLEGSVRWSGTTTLIFTPDEKKPLPYATRYEVRIDTTAKSVAGRQLEEPYVFHFTTPTVRLLQTNWYRKSHRASDPVVIELRFNQPVDPDDIARHVKIHFQKHDWKLPVFTPAGLARLKTLHPTGEQKFAARIAKAGAAAEAEGPVFSFLATEWDIKRFPKTDRQVVLETRPGVPPDSWMRLALDENLPSPQGPDVPGFSQNFVIQLEPTFFVDGFSCTLACNPDSRNSLRFRSNVKVSELRKRLTVTDITDPKKEVRLEPSKEKIERGIEDEEGWSDETRWVSLDELGYSIEPARTYAVTIEETLPSIDGQTLGYPWVEVVEFWHAPAFASFGDGHGVWEPSGGTLLPFYSRNFKDITQWIAPISIDELMPTLLRVEEKYYGLAPSTPPQKRPLNVTPDKTQSHGLDLKSVLSPQGTGLAWVAIKEGQPIPKAVSYGSDRIRGSIVQVTNLGISVKDSPLNTLIFVTRLDDAQPVPNARVAIRSKENKVVWEGQTDARGLATAPRTSLRTTGENEYWGWQLQFIVTAEKDGDIAYVGSNWNEGIEPWSFNTNFNLEEAKPLLRGTIFTDRGVYKLGEEIHFKAILRTDTPTGIELLPKDTAVQLKLQDNNARELDSRAVKLNEWSSAEWTFRLPGEGALGDYRVTATVEGQKRDVSGTFLVAAYRRPDFRVDSTLSGDLALAGSRLKGTILGRYLFGATMGGREAAWTYSKQPGYGVTASILDRFPPERFTFVGYDWDAPKPPSGKISSAETTLDAKGALALDLETDLKAGVPYVYTIEGNVTDVSRQRIAGRASLTVHPAPWYIGIKEPPYFADAGKGFDTEIIAVTPEGKTAPGVPVELTLTQVQWHSVRRAEGNGYYTWDTERREIPSGNWNVVTKETPAPLHIPLEKGGYYILKAKASDAEGRFTTTVTSFYALGGGYTAWQRHDHNRIDLISEKSTYVPGETARVMIQSPWEKATALVTTEREGVRTQRQFFLTSTQETVTIPITEADIPNVFVSVLLVKGRTKAPTDVDDTSDPGKPAFRLGYLELNVVDASKRLSVDVKANKEEYRPAAKAKVEVRVTDAKKQPVRAEVTLWAVDYGVLSLTAFKTPDVVSSIYVAKALQVLNEDSRQKIISRRVLTPKGATEGGGGGGPEADVRKDFRVLAFWLGSIVTNAKGEASTELTLPESLTTYRIMAVAGDRVSRFGAGESEIRINKPVLLKPAFPRFLALGDKSHFGAVVHNQLKQSGTAVVTMKSLDPETLAVVGEERKSIAIGAQGSAEVRFDLEAKSIGNARLRMTVKLLGQEDAFEDILPVRLLATPEVVAAYGTAKPTATETVEIPARVSPTYGGLQVEMSSTAMVGLAEGARYLVEYPYGCAEQRASTTLALLLASHLGDAFSIPGIEASKLKPLAQENVTLLETFQCDNGGFSYWPGECWYTSPYLTSYIVHVLQRGGDLGYKVTPEVLTKAYDYLESELAVTPPENEGWWPSYAAWQSFAVKVLAEGGRDQDSNITRLSGYLDRMPVFAISYLYDAMLANKEKGARVAEVHRRIANSILPEGGSAHVEELADPDLLFFWNSNIRSTAIVLGSLVRGDADERLITPMVRWLMNARKDGRWGNTQENALAMEGLIDYYRKFEAEVPDFTGTVSLGKDVLAGETFKGRSTKARHHDVPMRTLLERKTREQIPLIFERKGTGTFFYLARLRYASTETMLAALNKGFVVERSYSPVTDTGSVAPRKSYQAGQLVRITLRFKLPKERRWVAVTDPIPAGFEAVESWFKTTAFELTQEQRQEESGGDWTDWWRRGGFDHVERHDDRVMLFATRLSEGAHEFSYVVRATTAGTFHTAPAHVEEMYEPEVFGRSATDVIEVKP